MEIALIVWILMGIASGLIAAQKGRSGAGFGCLGALLGPFGILAAMLASKRDGIDGTQRNLAQCPDCAELIQAEALVCRYCGARDLLPPAKRVREVTPVIRSQILRGEERQMDWLKTSIAIAGIIVAVCILGWFNA
jgi:hypothetical protein